MSALPQNDIDTLIGKIKRFPYLCSFGTDSLGPLNGPPSVEPEVETADVTLYETEGEVEAQFLKKNNVMVTINTRNIEKAMALNDTIAKGDNLLASSKKKALTFVPITGATEPSITFANAYLQAGLKFNPGENGDPSTVELRFLCKADVTTGKPFTYGSSTPASGSGN